MELSQGALRPRSNQLASEDIAYRCIITPQEETTSHQGVAFPKDASALADP